jgi:hypothetical protein
MIAGLRVRIRAGAFGNFSRRPERGEPGDVSDRFKGRHRDLT